MITLIALIGAIFSIKTYKIEFNDITKTVNITESLFVGAKNEKKISYDEIKFTFSKNSFIKTQTLSSLKLDIYKNEKNEITINNLTNFENLKSLIDNSRQRFKTEIV